MSENKNFAKGLYINTPHENAPSFIKLSLKIHTDEFIPWLQAAKNAKGEVVININEGRNGQKLYGVEDTYKKEG